MSAGISIETIGDLLDEGYAIHAHCGQIPGCGRKLECDVYDLAIWLGRRQRFVKTRLPLRCSKCGGKDVFVTIQPDTRSREVAARGEAENFRKGRTVEERKALAAVFPRKVQGAREGIC